MSLDGKVEDLQVLRGKITALKLDKTLTKKGMCAEAKATGDALDKKVNITDIVNNFVTDKTDKPLSARQGMLLKNQIDDIDPHSADKVTFDNTISKLNSDDVQGAIDEVKATVDDVQTEVDDAQIKVNRLYDIQKIGFAQSFDTTTTEKTYYSYTATKKSIINLSFTCMYNAAPVKMMKITKNGSIVAIRNTVSANSGECITASFVINAGDIVACVAQYTNSSNNTIYVNGYVQYLE